MSSVAREWREISGRYNLKGTKCENCGQVYFPARAFCPKCRRVGIGKIKEYNVCRTGNIFTYSIIHEAPNCNSTMKPYAVAMVKTDDGIIVSAQIVDVDLDKIKIGMPVHAVLRKLGSDGTSGVIHYGYKFIPTI